MEAAVRIAVMTVLTCSRVYPASFEWFKPSMYAPALGFLMFAVGINLNAAAFLQVKPQVCGSDLLHNTSPLLHLPMLSALHCSIS